jgi:hypothetical protein
MFKKNESVLFCDCIYEAKIIKASNDPKTCLSVVTYEISPTHSYDELIILTCKGWIDLLYLKKEEKILKRGLEH